LPIVSRAQAFAHARSSSKPTLFVIVAGIVFAFLDIFPAEDRQR
jgi:hypothetical protein